MMMRRNKFDNLLKGWWASCRIGRPPLQKITRRRLGVLGVVALILPKIPTPEAWYVKIVD